MDRHERVRSYYDYVDAEEYEALFSLFADDIVYERPGHDPIEGIGAFRRFYLEQRPIEAGNHSIDDLYEDGETIVVLGSFEGRLAGEAVAFGFADVHHFSDDDLITHRQTYTDRGTV